MTSYGGELRYTVTHRAPAGAQPLPRQPDVLLQGNGILLEHFSDANPPSGVPTTVTVPFREVRTGGCPPHPRLGFGTQRSPPDCARSVPGAERMDAMPPVSIS